MKVIMHPLFLIALAVLVSWCACRWWYRRELAALRAAVARKSRWGSSAPGRDSDAAVFAERADDDLDSQPLPRQGVLFSGAHDYRYPPFVDTSPHTHDVGEGAGAARP